MSYRVSLLAAAGVALASVPALPQAVPVTLRGVAYDSLRGAPLGAASISIVGREQTTTSDAHGRFRFDGVPPGVYTLVMQHATLDTVGLRGVSRHATLTDGRSEIRIAVPSFATLWRAACGDRPPPADSAFIYGTIRDARTLAPVADARVALTWTDVFLDRQRRVVQRRWQLETRSAADGAYVVCGAPIRLGLRIHAATERSATGLIDLAPQEAPARRRDLLLGPEPSADTTQRGSIAGVLTDGSGNAVSGARIAMFDAGEVRTAPDGRFLLRDVPSGTRQLEVQALGRMPARFAMDVRPGETIDVALGMGRAITLRGVRVTAPSPERRFASEFEERRRSGRGYTMDSTAIARYPRFANVFHDIPGVWPEYHGSSFSLTVSDPRGGRCPPEVRIDGAEAAYGHLVDLFSEEVAAIEVYPRATAVPLEFQRPGVRPLCGIILVWTKYGFRNR